MQQQVLLAAAVGTSLTAPAVLATTMAATHSASPAAAPVEPLPPCPAPLLSLLWPGGEDLGASATSRVAVLPVVESLVGQHCSVELQPLDDSRHAAQLWAALQVSGG